MDNHACVYCGFVVGEQSSPALRDTSAWQLLGHQHAFDCEWIATRAHRLPSVSSDARLSDDGLDKLLDEALAAGDTKLAEACVSALNGSAYHTSIVALALHDADALRGT